MRKFENFALNVKSYFLPKFSKLKFSFSWQDGSVRQNKTLDQQTLQSYSRYLAFQSRNSNIRYLRNSSFERTDTLESTVDPFRSRFLPPKHQLISWQTVLSRRNEIEASVHYVHSEIGNLTYETIGHFLSLHTARDVKLAVEQEINWFNESKLIPRSVVSRPSNAAINAFKSLIWYHPNLEEIPFYRATPSILAQLCCTWEVNDEHVRNILSMLNKEQTSVRCIHINFVTNVQRFVQRRILTGENVPQKLCFIANVGMHANGKTFCGSNGQQGNHWVTAMYDHSERKLIYGDSLGWPIPDSLQQKVQLFADEIYQGRSSPISLEYCHDPESHSHGRRSCGVQCHKRYPLQTCGKVCGVVALVMAAIFCHKIEFLRQITANESGDESPMLYLTQPTKYSKYLRSVLMAWLAEKKINIDYVVTSDTQEDSDSNTDEEIARCPIVPETEDEPVATVKKVSILTEKSSTEVKTERPKKPIVINSHKARHQNQQKSFQCPLCNQTCSRKAHLVCHMERFHKGEDHARRSLQTGRCLCLQCGNKFRRIVDLRKHLSERHSFVFREETVEFNDRKGW